MINKLERKHRFIGYILALCSAALVGIFTVLNKWIMVEDVPALTAGAWTYFAAGVALLPLAAKKRGLKFKKPIVTIGWLLAGSVVGPILFFVGLKLTSGVEGVLLINTEVVFTAFLAFLFFKERITGKTLWASFWILAGGVLLSWSGNSLLSENSFGNLLIALGYVAWATENNLGRVLGEDIPAVTLVCIKAFVAAFVLAILALAFGESLTISWHVVPGIVASGSFSLGLSLALFYIAMSYIGAGRTGLISSTSTLWGVIGAILLLGEPLTEKIFGGGLLMLLGVAGFAWESSRE